VTPITELPPHDPRDIVTTETRLKSTDIAFLGVLLAVGAGLRLYRADTGLWFDEIVTLLDSVRHPLGTIVTHFPSNNDHPLYSVLAHLAVTAFGESPLVLRLPSVLFGIAAIPLLYLVGLAVTSRVEAGASALILTVSYHHIWFSQNARGYTLLLFCVLLSTYALVRWRETGRQRWLWVYAIATGFGAYAHLTMVLVCLTHALVCVVDWLWIDRARIQAAWKQLAAAFVGAGLLTIAFYAPMLADVSAFFTTRTATSTEVATPFWAMVAALRGLQVGFGALPAIAFGGIVFAAGTVSYLKEKPAVALLFLLPLPVTLLLAVALQRPIFPRFVFFAVGFGLLVIVRGGAALGTILGRLTNGRLEPSRAAVVVVALLTCGAVVVSLRSLPYGYRYPKQDYEQAVRFVEQEKQPHEVAVAVGETTSTPVERYLGRPWARVETAAQFQTLRADPGDLWVMYTFPSYIEAGQPELWTMLQSECPEIREFEGTVAGGTISVRRCP